MSDQPKPGSGATPPAQTTQPQTIVIQQAAPAGRGRRWWTRLLLAALFVSILINLATISAFNEFFSETIEPQERFHSGDELAADKIAMIEVRGTIMPPLTERILRTIERVKEDQAVKGVLLVIDSPGGFVADSHQIYHRLKELSREKPFVIAMKRMAASGGYYIAMGAGTEGKIFAEPTTWTGSIGVIIPRFDISELAKKYGIKSDPLKTGPFKDALSPFRELSEAERNVWTAILDDSFGRFLRVISENRNNLDYEAVEKLATGQVYTAEQAKANGLIDVIGFEDEALEDLQQRLGLENVRVVRYKFPPTLLDLLLGTVQARQPANEWRTLLESTVPRAMYYCSWAPVVPVPYGTGF